MDFLLDENAARTTELENVDLRGCSGAGFAGCFVMACHGTAGAKGRLAQLHGSEESGGMGRGVAQTDFPHAVGSTRSMLVWATTIDHADCSWVHRHCDVLAVQHDALGCDDCVGPSLRSG